jgi:hypothetical protein
MLLEMMFLAGTSIGTPTTIQAGSVVVTLTNNGACVIPDETKPWLADANPEATLTITWVEQNPDSSLYRVHLKRNGVFVAAYELGVQTAEYVIEDYTLNGTRAPLIDEDWTFSISVIRKSDSAVIQTRNAAVYAANFGKCNPGDIEA